VAQDASVSPDGKLIYGADTNADGMHVVDGNNLKQVRFVTVGVARRIHHSTICQQSNSGRTLRQP
jgi:phage protein U